MSNQHSPNFFVTEREIDGRVTTNRFSHLSFALAYIQWVQEYAKGSQFSLVRGTSVSWN